MLVLRFASLHGHRHLVATLVKARMGPPIHIGGYDSLSPFPMRSSHRLPWAP